MRDREAKFTVESFDPAQIIIRDVGPWDKHLSVTNDAEGVIARLDPAPMQRVFYYDSEGHLDELVHRDGKFLKFAPGPSKARDPGLADHEPDIEADQANRLPR